MGVDLKPILNSSILKISDLSNKTIAIDAYNIIYQFLATIRGPTGEPLANDRGDVTSHLSGLFYRNTNFLLENIKLVYIFDGKPHNLKKIEIERRKSVKEDAREKYEDALSEGRYEDARKYGQATSFLTKKMIEESKKLLNLLGIACIQAPSEGEATAADLTKNGIVYASASQDYDSLLFGAKKLIRNLTVSGKRKVPNKNTYINVEPEIFSLQDILDSLKITREQLVDIGILVGTDFNAGGFPGIGAKTALKLVRESKSLEKIDKVQAYLQEIPYQEIRDIFLSESNSNNYYYYDTNNNDKDTTTDTIAKEEKVNNIKFPTPNYDEVVNFLCNEMNFSNERVTTTLERLKKMEKTKSQSLEKWFG